MEVITGQHALGSLPCKARCLVPEGSGEGGSDVWCLAMLFTPAHPGARRESMRLLLVKHVTVHQRL